MDPADPAETPRVRLCRAFRQAYELAGLKQEALAELTGIKQAVISKYARGEVTPPPDVMEKVDIACGKPLGHVLRLAGYVKGDVDLAVAIERDPTFVDERGRQLMREAYRIFSTRSARPRKDVAAMEAESSAALQQAWERGTQDEREAG